MDHGYFNLSIRTARPRIAVAGLVGGSGLMYQANQRRPFFLPFCADPAVSSSATDGNFIYHANHGAGNSPTAKEVRTAAAHPATTPNVSPLPAANVYVYVWDLSIARAITPPRDNKALGFRQDLDQDQLLARSWAAIVFMIVSESRRNPVFCFIAELHADTKKTPLSQFCTFFVQLT